MSTFSEPEKPTKLVVVPPREALRQARPLPSNDDMAIEGLTDDEWLAFDKALTER